MASGLTWSLLGGPDRSVSVTPAARSVQTEPGHSFCVGKEGHKL